MSWGYFLDLNLTLPTDEWVRLATTKTGDYEIAPTWWGFREPALGDMFTGDVFDDTTIGDVVARFSRDESIGMVEVAGAETTLRLAQLLDRGGDPSIAKAVAALVDAAKSVATGKLRLVNDGSYSGEDGVEITVAKGKLARKAVKGGIELAMKLGAEIYGDLATEDAEADEPDEADEAAAGAAEDKRAKQPAAKQRAAKPAATKRTAKQPAANKRTAKPAAKQRTAKPAAKQRTAKQPAAKKRTAKQPATTKRAAKRSATKRTPAKRSAAKRR